MEVEEAEGVITATTTTRTTAEQKIFGMIAPLASIQMQGQTMAVPMGQVTTKRTASMRGTLDWTDHHIPKTETATAAGITLQQQPEMRGTPNDQSGQSDSI